MLNVLHIITGLSDGGAEAVLYRICTYDKENKHTVISLMDEGKYGPLLRKAGVGVYCLHVPRRKVNIKSLLKLYKRIKSLQPDVVQTWMYHADLIGGVVARMAGVKSVFWGIRHSDLVPGVSPYSTILVARICALLSRFVPKFIICCSQRSMKIHKALGYCAKKLVCIPNGYDLSHFKPDPELRKKTREELGVESNTPLLGMVARYDPQKDHKTLVAALSILKRKGIEFKCLLIGTGMIETNEGIKKIIMEEDLTDNIQLLGRREDIPAIMNALDLHVLSSSFGEAFPNVLAEAMACGTPCVATDVGDSAYIIGKTGWIVPSKDTSNLAMAIGKALKESKDPEVWNIRADSARKRITNNFEISVVVKKYNDYWGTLTKNFT